MAQVVIPFTPVCQMSDNPSGKPTSSLPEELGYGSGGNRCTESCNAMIAWQLNLANVRTQFANPEDLMFWFTEQRNGGRDVSGLRNGQEVLDWVNANGGKMKSVKPSYDTIKALVRRGNVAMAGFSDYNKLQKADGGSPYSWHDPDGDGHVLMVVGYNDDDPNNPCVYVNDPLQGTRHQPWLYSYKGFVAAQFDSLAEVQLANSFLSDYFTNNPDGTLTCKKNGLQLYGAILQTYMADPDPLNNWGLPISAEKPLPNTSKGGVYREFELGDIWYDPENLNSGKPLNKFNCYRGFVERSSPQEEAQIAADLKQIDELNQKVNDLTKQLMSKTPADVVAAINSIYNSVQSVLTAIEAVQKEVA